MTNSAINGIVSTKRLILLSISIILALIFTLAGLNRFGLNSRVFDDSLSVSDAGVKGAIINMPIETYSIWKERGYKGRTVVNLSARFNFEAIDDMDSIPDMDFPLETYNVSTRLEVEATSKNFLVVATRNGIARKIMHVVTPASYNKALKALENRHGISVNNGVIEVPFFASPRSIRNLEGLTAIHEPVLLFADASIFREHTPKEVYEKLKKVGIRTDYAVLSLSSEDPDVSERERDEMKAFAGFMGVK